MPRRTPSRPRTCSRATCSGRPAPAPREDGLPEKAPRQQDRGALRCRRRLRPRRGDRLGRARRRRGRRRWLGLGRLDGRDGHGAAEAGPAHRLPGGVHAEGDGAADRRRQRDRAGGAGHHDVAAFRGSTSPPRRTCGRCRRGSRTPTRRTSRASSSRRRTTSRRTRPPRSSSTDQLEAFERAWAQVDLTYARSKNLTPYDVLIIASMVEKEVQVPAGAPARRRGRSTTGSRQGCRSGSTRPSGTARHPADPGDPAEPARRRPPVQHAQARRACRRRRSRTRASPRSRRRRTRPTSTTSTSCARRTARATSSRPAEREFNQLQPRGDPVLGARAATTTLVGLLRHPLRDSLSPPMQNAAFGAAGLDWAYVALGVEPERLEDAVAGLVALGFAGANVTIPHKTGVLAFCDELDDVAGRAGSVNTLVIRDGRVLGSTTDGLAVTGAVEATGARRARPRGGRGRAGGGDRARGRGVRLTARRGAHAGGGPRTGHCACGTSRRGVRSRRTSPGRRLPATPTSSSTRRPCWTSCWSSSAASARSSISPTARTEATRRSSRPRAPKACERVVDGLEVLVGQGAALLRALDRAARAREDAGAIRERARVVAP